MVLVTRAARGRGYGTRLLKHCIDITRARGAAAGLDATEVGRPVYLKLGFRDLYPISRWRIPAGARLGDVALGGLRPLRPGDIEALVSFDFRAKRNGARAHPQVSRRGGIVFSMVGRTAWADRWLCSSALVALPPRSALSSRPRLRSLVFARCAGAIERSMMIDVADEHHDLKQLLENAGAVRERGFIRMMLGDADEKSSRIRVMSSQSPGPELG